MLISPTAEDHPSLAKWGLKDLFIEEIQISNTNIHLEAFDQRITSKDFKCDFSFYVCVSRGGAFIFIYLFFSSEDTLNKVFQSKWELP